MSNSNFVIDAIRSLFTGIDKGIYGFIGTVFNLIVMIAESEVINSSIVSNITEKLYSFIGIFMLFKVSFSIINYIINPDSINDQKKGGGKIIANIIITFVLIIFVPFGFKQLYRIQSAVLNSKVLENLILGDFENAAGSNSFKISPKCHFPVNVSSGNDNYDKGEYIAMIAIRPFVQIRDDIDDATFNSFNSSTLYCKATNISELMLDSATTYNKGINDSNSKKKTYVIDYNFLLSTLVGILILCLFAGFTLDVASRSIKLLFLEIIAPIPVISYIDPTSGKDGMFNKWLKEVGKTWADLFVRLISVYFAVFIISSLNDGMTENTNYLINLFIILGALIFAKKFPDLLKKLFNIDLKGNFSLNPLKKLQNEALFGKQIAGLATGAASAGLGAIRYGRNQFANKFGIKGVHPFKTFGATGLGNAMSAGFKGGYSSPSTFKGLNSGMKVTKDKVNEEFKKENDARKAINKQITDDKKANELITNALYYEDVEEEDDDGNIHRIRKYKLDNNKLYKNKEFIESCNKVDSAKKVVSDLETELEVANKNLQNATPEMTNELAAKKVQVQNKLNKARSELEEAKKTHELVRNIYKDDAKREDLKKMYSKKYVPVDEPLDKGESSNNNQNSEETQNSKETQNSNYRTKDQSEIDNELYEKLFEENKENDEDYAEIMEELNSQNEEKRAESDREKMMNQKKTSDQRRITEEIKHADDEDYQDIFEQYYDDETNNSSNSSEYSSDNDSNSSNDESNNKMNFASEKVKSMHRKDDDVERKSDRENVTSEEEIADQRPVNEDHENIFEQYYDDDKAEDLFSENTNKSTENIEQETNSPTDNKE